MFPKQADPRARHRDLLDEAEDRLARLDERLRTSPIRDGWIARTHLTDAAASLFLDGDHVALDDLVLHDLAMDVRAPTHELTRARMMLAARRRIVAAPPGWGRGHEAHDILLGRLGPDTIIPAPEISAARDGEAAPRDDAFAEIDALIARTTRLLARGSIGAGRPGDEPKAAPPDRLAPDRLAPDRLTQWRDRLAATEDLSPVAAAAAAGHAWDELRPVDNAAWLGRLLAADVLRMRGKTRAHLCPLNLGLKAVARADRQSRDPAIRLRAWIQGFGLAAETGLRDHDRWLATQQVLTHRLKGRRASSSLPGLVALVLRHPLVTSAMIARELGVSKRAAQDLASELGLREMTGRARYRAWGIL